jgi:hypothetical protein
MREHHTKLGLIIVFTTCTKWRLTQGFMMMQKYHTIKGPVLVNAQVISTSGRIIGGNEPEANLLYQEVTAAVDKFG